MAETGDISGAGVAGTATGNSGGNSVLNLTNREQEILSKAIMCLKSPPDVSNRLLSPYRRLHAYNPSHSVWPVSTFLRPLRFPDTGFSGRELAY